MNYQQKFPFRFYDDQLEVFVLEGPKYYVALRGMCLALGLSDAAQRRRILATPALSDRLIALNVPTDYRGSVRMQEAFCLDVEALPYWLGSLDVNRIREELREKIILYQREVVSALWAVFRSSILPRDMLAEADQHLPPFEQEFHRRMDELQDFRRSMENQVSDIGQRLGELEARVLRGLPVNSQQALHIKDMVAALADNLAATTGRTRSKAFSDVYSELYHTFDVAIYTEIPQTEYNNAVEWFKRRWRTMTPDRPLPSVFARGRQNTLGDF